MKDDIHGRNRLTKNALISWTAQGIQIIGGFILPRLVDGAVGQGGLGIWDFAWSVVGYFTLITGGVVSSINRYVAKYRASGSNVALISFISTAGFIVRGMGLTIFILAISFAIFPYGASSENRLEFISLVRYLVLILGMGMAVQVSASVYSGVLTGFHRWDIHNGIQILVLTLSLGLSVAVLLLGGGLVMLALAQLASEVIGRICQIVAAKKVYSDLKIKWKFFRQSFARDMLIFGGKTYVNVIAALVANQTVSLLIGGLFGPAALALFSRPRLLVRRIGFVVQRYAMLFVPTVSSLTMTGDMKGIQAVALSATRIAICISLPFTLFMIFLGGDLLEIWMGSRYRASELAAVLALGGLFEIAYMPLYRTLMGMNLHGRLVSLNLATAIITAGFAYYTIKVMHGGLIAVGLATVLPTIIAQGILAPVIFARALKITSWQLIVSVWMRPVIYASPYCLVLVGVKALTGWEPWMRIMLTICIGGGSLLAFYWVGIVPKGAKQKIRQRLTKGNKKVPLSDDLNERPPKGMKGPHDMVNRQYSKIFNFLIKFSEEIRQRGWSVFIRHRIKHIWSKSVKTVWTAVVDAESPALFCSNAGVDVKIAFGTSQCMESLAKAWPAELPQYRSRFLSTILCERLSKGNICLIAKYGESIVGAVWISPYPERLRVLADWNSSNVWLIQNLFVVSAFRNKKIALLLLKKAMETATSHGISRLVSLIFEDRDHSIRAHAKAGFRKSGILREKSFMFKTKKRFIETRSSEQFL